MGYGYTQKSAQSWCGPGFLIAITMYLAEALWGEGLTVAHSFRGPQSIVAEKLWQLSFGRRWLGACSITTYVLVGWESECSQLEAMLDLSGLCPQAKATPQGSTASPNSAAK